MFNTANANGDWLISDEVVNAALGAEIRRAREAIRVTRQELVAELPFKTTVPTLTNWETGKRGVSHARLIDIARTLNTSAPELLRRAIERVETIQSLVVELDLRPLCDDEDPQYELLRTWAKNKRATMHGDRSTVRVHHTVIRELAVLLGIHVNRLVKHLTYTASFEPVCYE